MTWDLLSRKPSSVWKIETYAHQQNLNTNIQYRTILIAILFKIKLSTATKSQSVVVRSSRERTIIHRRGRATAGGEYVMKVIVSTHTYTYKCIKMTWGTRVCERSRAGSKIPLSLCNTYIRHHDLHGMWCWARARASYKPRSTRAGAQTTRI